MDGLSGYVILAVSDENSKICLFGSPAWKDCDDLKAEDRILEVNGQDLSDSSYLEVLKHIHKCIKSKKIALRVKRFKCRKGICIENIPPGKRAIALAVEGNALKRLSRLTKRNKVKEIDRKQIPSGVNSVISSPIYITDFPRPVKTAQSNSNGAGETNGTSQPLPDKPIKQTKGLKERHNSNSHKPEKTSTMASAVMHRGGNTHQYRNGHVSHDDQHSEMAVDCPPSYVAAHPPNGGIGTPRLETPPPTPINPQGVQAQKANTEKDLQAVAAVAATLPQPEMDLTRIHRMRESMNRKKEIRKRDQQVREDMAKEDNAEKLRKIKTMTPEEEVAQRMQGVYNDGYEDDSSFEDDSSVEDVATLNIEGIFEALHDLSKDLDEPTATADLAFVRTMMQNDSFQEAMDLHNTIAKHTPQASTSCVPVQSEILHLLEEVEDDLTSSKEGVARELEVILSKHHMKGLMDAHDGVAANTYRPSTHPPASGNFVTEDKGLLQRAAMYTTKPAKIVSVKKTNIPLGATVRVEEDGSVVISRVVVGGAAEKSGVLHEDDEILEVNGQAMRGKDVNEVGDAISAMSGMLKFLIVPADGKVIANGQANRAFDTGKEPIMHIRALFDYDAFEDPYLPCRELGLSFRKGDILHVLSQEDPDWWQAYREGDEDQLTLPGLIPGQNFQHQLEVIRLSLDKKEEEPEIKQGLVCGKKKRKKKKKTKKKTDMDSVSESGDEIEVYEEMALYHQPESKKRPIVLIGPPNVGRHELRQRLVENDKDRFAFAVPHTTRPRSDGELDGQDYHFVSMKDFELMISKNKFLEHGSFQKNLYGTTIDAVQRVIDNEKICVINLHAESLRLLKTTSLKPYILFIAPPSLERLRQNVSKEGKQIKEDELRKIIESARDIEKKYAHYFDEIICNTDLSRSYAELLRHINKLETEPQWVPAAWLD